ncbi:hypothetical protein HanIR_Chr04g0207411 [Helianthus annuus]|nr:hypothetical protein HanIR_Chr04g0207411 [Helianthus annuus]
MHIQKLTRSLVLGGGGEEGHKGGTAKEFGDEYCGVGLSLWCVLYGSQALPENAILVASFSKNAAAITTHDWLEFDHVTNERD